MDAPERVKLGEIARSCHGVGTVGLRRHHQLAAHLVGLALLLTVGWRCRAAAVWASAWALPLATAEVARVKRRTDDIVGMALVHADSAKEACDEVEGLPRSTRVELDKDAIQLLLSEYHVPCTS